jgi:hypothetical protein
MEQHLMHTALFCLLNGFTNTGEQNKHRFYNHDAQVILTYCKYNLKHTPTQLILTAFCWSYDRDVNTSIKTQIQCWTWKWLFQAKISSLYFIILYMQSEEFHLPLLEVSRVVDVKAPSGEGGNV